MGGGSVGKLYLRPCAILCHAAFETRRYAKGYVVSTACLNYRHAGIGISRR
jgi:hypothetical protein